MGVAIDVVRVACNTSTGNQTITGDVGGLTPKAAMFVVSYGVTDGTAANEKSISIGACDATREWHVCCSSQHNVATTQADHQNDTSNVITLIDPTTSSLEGVAAFSSFGADNVTINWGTAPDAAYLLTVTLFAGSDLTVRADNTGSLGNTVDLETDVNSLGFEPDIVIPFFAESVTSVRPNGRLSGGFSTNDGAGARTQRTIAPASRDARATSDITNNVSDLGVMIFTSIGTGSVDWYADIDNYDSSGFSIFSRASGANNDHCYYLALALGGAVGHKIITHTTPTSTGSNAETGVGFKPQFVLMLGHHVEALSTAINSADAGTFSLSAWSSSAQFCTSVSDEHNVGTTNTQSLSDNVALNVPLDDGTAGLTATLTSFDTNGWTLNYTAVDAAAKLCFALCIEEESAAAAGQAYISKIHPARNVLLRL